MNREKRQIEKGNGRNESRVGRIKDEEQEGPGNSIFLPSNNALAFLMVTALNYATADLSPAHQFFILAPLKFE